MEPPSLPTRGVARGDNEWDLSRAADEARVHRLVTDLSSMRSSSAAAAGLRVVRATWDRIGPQPEGLVATLAPRYGSTLSSAICVADPWSSISKMPVIVALKETVSVLFGSTSLVMS